ncbi:MAG TPA: hypothetical protein VET65_08300 [Candidatus Limnocylindrales bacterium]|nr:hypothetical protein [Candidatus Limnocylindrales bacterium]
MRRRLVPALIVLAIAATALALIALQLAAGQQNKPVSTQASPGCTQPCADAGGYVMQVRRVEVTGGLVRAEVALSVHGRDSMHSEPFDFVLVDASHARTRPVFDAPGCPQWPRTPIPNGTSFGPQPLCFRPASTSAPLTLSWEPDLGLFSTAFPVRLR